MKDLFVLFAHLITTFAKLIGPGGAKAVIAENLLLKQQLLIINRSRQKGFPFDWEAQRKLLGFVN